MTTIFSRTEFFPIVTGRLGDIPYHGKYYENFVYNTQWIVLSTKI